MENLKGMGMVGGAYLPQLQGDGKAFPVPQCLILPRCSAAWDTNNQSACSAKTLSSNHKQEPEATQKSLPSGVREHFEKDKKW